MKGNKTGVIILGIFLSVLMMIGLIGAIINLVIHRS